MYQVVMAESLLLNRTEGPTPLLVSITLRAVTPHKVRPQILHPKNPLIDTIRSIFLKLSR